MENIKILYLLKKYWISIIISVSIFIPIAIVSINIIFNLNINTPPPFELSYEVIEENKLIEKGLYQTIFKIFVKRPGGNFQGGYKVISNTKANCSLVENTDGSQSLSSNGRQIYEISSQNMKCVSGGPIIDNGKLFSVKGIN